MRTFFVFVLVAWLPSLVASQVVTVRSGEHDGFSRLVFDLGEKTDSVWEVSQSGAVAIVTIDGRQFQPQRLFDLIPRTRIADIVFAGARAEIDLACDCFVDSFVYRDRYIVLDVRDAPLEGARAETAETPRQGADQRQVTEIDIENTIASLGLPRAMKPSQTEPSMSLPGGAPPLERALAGAISQAITKGYLGAPPPAQTPERAVAGLRNSSEKTRQAPSAAAPLMPVPKTPVLPKDVEARLLAEVVSTSDAGTSPTGPEIIPSAPRNRDGELCRDDAFLNLINDVETDDFASQQAALRRHLYREFDVLDEDVAHRYIALLVSHGFGVEARKTLTEVGLSDPDGTILLATFVAERGHAPHSHEWASQLSCRSVSALWAALAMERIGADEAINAGSILHNFQRLPRPLQHKLGPVLIDRFRVADAPNVADALHRVLARTLHSGDEHLRLAQARILIQKGELAEADVVLSPLIFENFAEVSSAMLELLALRERTQARFSEEEAAAIMTQAFMDRDSDQGAQLGVAAVKASAKAGQFSAAVEQAVALGFDAELQVWLSEYIALHSPMEVFLEFAFSAEGGEFAFGFSPPFAQRLADLGFVEKAVEYGYVVPDVPVIARPQVASLDRREDTLPESGLAIDPIAFAQRLIEETENLLPQLHPQQ